MAAFASFAAPAAMAQPFTKADSGWVPLFDGRTFAGFYSRMLGKQITDLPDEVFSIDSGMIKVTQGPGLEQGHIGTDRKFTHYRARFEYRLADTAGSAGLAYHTDETVKGMQNGWPRSIDCRLTQGDAGRVRGIAMTAFTTRGANGRFDPAGDLVDVCENISGGTCGARDFGPGAILDEPGRWNKLEVVVRGSDSALHLINDSTVLRLWDIRAPADSNAAAFAPHGAGSLTLKAEGAGFAIRNWEIMALPPDGPSFLQQLFLTNTDGEAHLTPGGTHAITWRTLGEVNKVSLFWQGGDGNWEMMADNITNTGSFEWTVPATTTRNLRVMVSAAPWVKADTSAADNSIGPGSGLVRRASASPPNAPSPFGLRGERDVSGRAQDGAEIRSGRRILYPAR